MALLLGLYLLLFCDFSSVLHARYTAYEQPQFLIANNTVTHEEAARSCLSLGRGWNLPDGTNQTDVENLMTFLEQKNISSAWLAPSKTVGTWRWVNNTTLTGDIAATAHQYCGMLSVTIQGLTSVRCNQQAMGFLCYFPDRNRCPESHFTNLCFTDVAGEHLFMLGCNCNSWYDARSVCLSKGGDLAILDTDAKQTLVLDHINSLKLTKSCGSLFVGLSRETWSYSKQGYPLTSKTLWNEGILRHDQHDCMTFQYIQGKYTRVSVYCTEKCTTICQNLNWTNYELKPHQVVSSHKCHNYAGFRISTAAVVTILSLVIVAIIVGVMWYVWRRRKCLGYEDKKLSVHKVISDDIHNILPYQEKTTTIVIFNQHALPQDEHVEVTNYPPSTETNNSSEELAIIKELYSKIHASLTPISSECPGAQSSSHKLRILNIHGIQMNSLSSKDAEKYLDLFLGDNNGMIDIICFPKVTDGVNNTMVESFWKLKQKSVVITFATNHPCLPASEVIATHTYREGGVKQSTVLDFAIQHPYEDFQEDSAPLILTVICTKIVEHFKKANQWTTETNKTRKMVNCLQQLAQQERDLPHAGLYKGKGTLDIRREIPSFTDITANRLTVRTRSGELSDSLNNLSNNIELKEEVSPVRIAVVRKGINAERYKGWKIINHSEAAKELNMDPNVLKASRASDYSVAFLFKAMETHCHSLIKDKLKTTVEIIDIPLFSDTWMSQIDYGSALSKIIQKGYDIVHIPGWSSKENPPIDLHIHRNTDILRNESVVITPARHGYQLNQVTQYPAQMVISVGFNAQKGKTGNEATDKTTLLPVGGPKRRAITQSQGATLDFICGSDDVMNQSAASFYATGIASLILIYAHALDINDDQLKKLKRTEVMHGIMRDLCSHPQEHHHGDGWGLLQIDGQLDIGRVKGLIEKHTSDNVRNNSWTGKNF